jgi:hypothetical protein
MEKPIFVANKFRMAFSKHGMVSSQPIMVQLSRTKRYSTSCPLWLVTRLDTRVYQLLRQP